MSTVTALVSRSSKNCAAIPAPAERLDVWTALAAGVESVTSAVVTMPTLNPLPRVRRRISPKYSMRGLSKASAVLSGNTPSWLLLCFWPVTYDDIPGEESVMTELSALVMTMPVTGSVSMARRPAALPLWRPREMRRAAVRCAAPMPSPRKRMTLRARGVPAARVPVHASTRRCDSAEAPSASARMTSGPASSCVKPRQRKLADSGGAPVSASGAFIDVTSRPFTQTCREGRPAPGSAVASTRMSRR